MLKTKLGRVKLKSPLVLSSGILGTNAQIMKRCIDNGAGAVTLKSIGPIERNGNNNPTVVEIDNGIYNAVGLPTPGYLNMEEEWEEIHSIIKAPVIASIYGSSIDDYVKIAAYLQKQKPAIIELNISCPNKDEGMVFGTDEELTKKLVSSVKKVSSIPVMPKLTPNCDNIAEIAVACEKAGADMLCAINTVQREILHPELKVPLLAYGRGGISGPIIKEIALKKVREIREAVRLPILGVGGVTYGKDAIDMFKAGASAVGIGSAVYFRGIDVFDKINKEIEDWMKENKVKEIKEMIRIEHR